MTITKLSPQEIYQIAQEYDRKTPLTLEDCITLDIDEVSGYIAGFYGSDFFSICEAIELKMEQLGYEI